MKYNIFLAGFILLPLLLIGYIIFFVVKVNRLLILHEGTIVEYKSGSAGARSNRIDSIKFKEYPNLTFTRSYEGLVRFITPTIREEVYAAPVAGINANLDYLHPNLTPEANRKAAFFTPQTNELSKQQSRHNVEFVYLRLKSTKFSWLMYGLHLYLYAGSIYKIGLVTFISFMIFVGCYLMVSSTNQRSPALNGYAILIAIIHVLILII